MSLSTRSQEIADRFFHGLVQYSSFLSPNGLLMSCVPALADVLEILRLDVNLAIDAEGVGGGGFHVGPAEHDALPLLVGLGGIEIGGGLVLEAFRAMRTLMVVPAV